MEIKKGMYVRFKDKRNIEYIRQITEIPKDNRYASIYLDREANYSKGLSFKNVIKASNNIFDLIKVGDVVAIKEYIDKFAQIFILNIYEPALLKEIKAKIESGKLILDSVVTKEQFDLMKYEI